MTTAQDQQSRELLPCPFCGQQDAFVEQLDTDASVVICDARISEHCACLARGPVAVRDDEDEMQPGRTAAIAAWNRRAPAVQAARALPASMKPVAEIYAGDLFRMNQGADAEPVTGDHDLYTAAQVLAMCRVPPGCVAVERKILEDASESLGNFVSDHGWGDSDMAAADNLSAVLAAAPRPPAAQKRYRLLVRDVDTIQANDEFLRDADSNWQIDPQGIFVGMAYMSNVLLPARRAIEPAP